MLKISIIVVLLFLLSLTVAYTFDNDIGHRDITKNASELSSINSTLVNKLGLELGLKTTIKNKSIIDWIRDGAFLEDAPSCRASNHFHNPLYLWNNSAMSDEPLWLDVICLGWKPWYSNIVWATGYQSDTGPLIRRKNQTMGWDNARSYYYSALSSSTRDGRDANFVQAFSAVGHVMHLLQDMAVPAHVRNDFKSHLTFNGLIGINLTKWYGNPFEHYVQTNPGIVSRFTVAPNVPAFINPRVTAFWDTNQNGSILGLAEITNANYFSDETIPNNNPTSEHSFTSPQITIDSVNQYLCKDKLPGSGKLRKYVSRKPCPLDGSSADHFAALSLLNSETDTSPNNPRIKEVWLDDNVHDTYTQELLPRAIGYSAALIDYFFRGKLGVAFVPSGIRVKNLSAEDMTSYIDQTTGQAIGSIEIYYDDANSNRHRLATYDLATSPTPVIGPGQTSAVIEFTPPAANITAGRYIIVFRGRLGNEDGAVAGRVYSPAVYYIARLEGRDKIMRGDAGGGPSSAVYDTRDPNLSLLRISLSPDSSALVMAVKTPTSVYNATIVHLDLATDITTTVTEGNGPDWSPAGNRIAFSRELGRGGMSADEQLFTRDLSTGAENQLTNRVGSSYFHPSWSPDGGTIAYTSFNYAEPGCSNNFTIDLINANGSNMRHLTCAPDDTPTDYFPDWSPDGRRIAFSRYTGIAGYTALYSVDVATGIAVKLNSTESGYDERTPAWSPDGNYIAAATQKDGDYDIWLVDPAGKGYLRNLTAGNPEYDVVPVFGR